MTGRARRAERERVKHPGAAGVPRAEAGHTTRNTLGAPTPASAKAGATDPADPGRPADPAQPVGPAHPVGPASAGPRRHLPTPAPHPKENPT